MKKQLMTACAAALIAMGMTACDKTGTIEGVVLDPFTEQPVPMPTVWMDSTIYTTTKEKYPFKDELQKGEFKFQKVPVGSYRILAGRSKYVKSRNPVQTTEDSDQVNPGLYKTGEKTPTKINNEWVLFSTQCTESIAGYRLEMPAASETAKLPPAPKADKKAKGKKGKKAKKAAAPAAAPASKMIALSAPLVVDGKLNVLYVNASSVTAPLVEGYRPPGDLRCRKPLQDFWRPPEGQADYPAFPGRQDSPDLLLRSEVRRFRLDSV